MVNKHTADCHSSPSQITSQIPSLIFLWTHKGFISPEFFLNIFLNVSIPPWLRKSFKFMVLRLLATTLVSQEIDSVHFYSCPQAEGNHYLPGRRKLSIPPKQRFLKIYFFFSRKDGG